MATNLDLIVLCLRQIGVLAADEQPGGAEAALLTPIINAEFARVKAEQGFAWTWAPASDNIPDEALIPLSAVIGAAVAPIYNRPAPNYSRAIMALRAWSFPDDREDPADTDDDGTVTAQETDAYERARYY